MGTMKSEAAAILVHKLRAMSVFLRVGIPYFDRIPGRRQHLVVERVVRRMIEQTELGLERVSNNEYSAFPDQRIVMIGIEQGRERLVAAMDRIEDRQPRIPVAVGHTDEEHVSLSLDIGHQLRKEHVKV